MIFAKDGRPSTVGRDGTECFFSFLAEERHDTALTRFGGALFRCTFSSRSRSGFGLLRSRLVLGE